MSRLSPKYIALALNAYIGWEGAERDAEGALLDCAASRVLQMRDDPVTEYTFPSQVWVPVKCTSSIAFDGLVWSFVRLGPGSIAHTADCLMRARINRRASL